MTVRKNASDNAHDRELYAAILDHATPASDLEKLNWQAMVRIRAAASDAAGATVTHHASLSRRRFVTLSAGAAVIAGVGLLGIGLPMFGGREGAGDTGTDAGASIDSDSLSAASRAAGVPSFGLAVAYANEGIDVSTDPGAAFELSATDVGLIPMVTQNTQEVQLRLNLSVVGQGIQEVTYRIDGQPVFAPAFDDPWAVQSPPALAISFQEHVRQADADAIGGKYFDGFTQYTPVLKNQQNGEGVGQAPKTDSFVARADDVVWVDRETLRTRSSEGADGVGDAVTGRGTYQLLIVEMPTWFWESDPTLALFRDYENLRRHVALAQAKRAHPDVAAYSALVGMDDDELEAKCTELEVLSGELEAALDELLHNAQTTYEWMRSCYVTNLRTVAELLSTSTIRVIARFEDGTTGERTYHINPIDGFNDIAGARFDGLYELSNSMFVPLEEIEKSMQTSWREAQRKQEEYGGARNPFARWFVKNSTSRSNISASSFPYCGTITGEPDPAVDDERLRAALFTITDVTQ